MSIKPIGAEISELFEDSQHTFLSADVSSGGAELTVQSIKEFAINQVLMIGELGNEKTEIIKTHASTAPSGSTITLASNLVFAHSQGAKVYIIDYDQIEFSHADTEAGAKSVLATEDIEADSVQTLYKDATESAGYYFVRFKNSIDNSYSDYSDPIPYAGFGDNTVSKAINYALQRNKTELTENVTQEFLIEEINNCLNYIRGKLKKWHRLQEFEYILGQTSRGVYRLAVPSNMWGYSNKSVLGVRIGKGDNLTYKDKREWESELENVIHTTLSAGASIGDTSITIANSYDFDASGTVMIKGQEITYTANDRSTGELSGVPASGTGSITADISADDDVWQDDYEEGTPDIYTIYGGYLYFWSMCDSSNINLNVFLDYFKEAPSVDSEGDTLDISRYEMVKHWLTWVIRCQIKNDGIKDLQDGDYIMFERILKDAIYVELNSKGQKYKYKVQLNKIIF